MLYFWRRNKDLIRAGAKVAINTFYFLNNLLQFHAVAILQLAIVMRGGFELSVGASDTKGTLITFQSTIEHNSDAFRLSKVGSSVVYPRVPMVLKMRTHITKYRFDRNIGYDLSSVSKIT